MNIKHSLKEPIYLSSVSIKKKTETKVNKTIGLDFNLISIILYSAKCKCSMLDLFGTGNTAFHQWFLLN